MAILVPLALALFCKDAAETRIEAPEAEQAAAA
jgi:hypothetical protein